MRGVRRRSFVNLSSHVGEFMRRPNVEDEHMREALRQSLITLEQDRAAEAQAKKAMEQSRISTEAAPPASALKQPVPRSLTAFVHPFILQKVRITDTVPNFAATQLQPAYLAAYRAAMIEYWLQPEVIVDFASKDELAAFFSERSTALQAVRTGFQFPISLFQFQKELATHILDNQLLNPPLDHFISSGLMAGTFEFYASFMDGEERSEPLLAVHLLLSQLFIVCHLRGARHGRRYPQVARALQMTNVLLS